MQQGDLSALGTVELSSSTHSSSRRLLPEQARPSGSQASTGARRLHSTRTGVDIEGCSLTWFDTDEDVLAIALQRSQCTSVVLHLEAGRKLIDPARLPVALPTNVTIIGNALPDGSLPQLVMSPYSRVRTQPATHWHFATLEVLALSLDWFSDESSADQPSISNDNPTPALVHVSMSGCVLRSMRCAPARENDMAQSWLESIAGEAGFSPTSEDPSNTIGTIRESGWVAAAPWTPTATPPAVMFKFENTTTACAPEDDTAISEVLHSAEAHAGPAADDPSGSGGDCYLASDRGRGYSGSMATTESGRACLHWGEHDQPGGGNIFSDPRLQDMGLDGAACRNPLGMLDRPWCFVAEKPYIERCAVDACAVPVVGAEATTLGAATGDAWVQVLIVICSIAGVLLIALLLVLLVRALMGGALCPGTQQPPRSQGRSKREGASTRHHSALGSFSSDEQAMSEVGGKDAADSPVASVQHSASSGRTRGSRPPSGRELPVVAQPAMPSTRARPHSYSPAYSPSANHKSPMGSAQHPDMYRRYSEPHGAPVSSHLNSVSNHTRSSTGDGRSCASSRGLRPTTPPLGKSHSSHTEIRSQGSPMHPQHRAQPSSEHGCADWQNSERLQQGGSVRSPREDAPSTSDDRFALIASPTLRQIMECSSLPAHRMYGANSGAGAPEQHKRIHSSGKSPREGDLRQRTIEEELAYMHGMHDAAQRGMVYSVDSRSYATSSLQDVVHSAAFASGAVNSGVVSAPTARSNTRTGTADLDLQRTTETSTIALDTPSATVADQHTHSGSMGVDFARDRPSVHHPQYATAGTEMAANGARAAAAAAVAGVHASWGLPYRRQDRPDTERTISGSWTNSNSSPTGTLASRVAMQSPAGASFNMSAGEGGAALETFQSDRDSQPSQYQVNLWEHDIKIGKRLGRGSFAQVFQGLWNDTAVAIKVIEYKEGARDAVDPCMEASLTKELTHPNVVITYDYGWTSHEVNSLLSVRPESIVMVILMEYCNLKSLATNIRHTNRFGHQSGSIKWVPIAHALIDILRGLTYLHDMDIIHGDIKAANVMLKSVHKSVSPVKFTAKLADLGLAQLRGDAVSADAVGSLTHAAPELLNSRCNTPQSDIYAFGVLMYEIISGKEPFKGLSVTDLIRLKTSTDTADTLVLEAGEDRVYAAFAEIFNQCVASEPSSRPTCKELFRQLRAVSTNSGLSSHDSAAHYQSIRVCPDSCSSPRYEMFTLGTKAASLASQSSRYSRSPRSTDAHGAAQAWANQSPGGYPNDRRGMHRGLGSTASSYVAMHMRSQLSPRARSGWRSPSATSPHSQRTSQHGSPAHSRYPEQQPFSNDPARHPGYDDPSLLGMAGVSRIHTLGSLSGGAMSPTHSERAVTMDIRRYEPARSGSVASSVHDPTRSSQADLAGTYERISSLSARQRAHSTGVLSASGQSSAPAPHVAYRQTHVYPTGAPAIGAPSDAGHPISTAASGSNGTSSARMSLCMREPVNEHCAVQSGMPGLGSPCRPTSADQLTELQRSMSAHRRSSGGVPQGAHLQHASPSGSQQPEASVPGSMEVYDAVFSNPAAVLTANDGGDETAPEDGDSSSDESQRGTSHRAQRAHDNSEMAAAQATLGALDSTDSFADRRQLNLGSVDSFNLEMGNSSNLQRLMRDHGPAAKGGAVLADGASGPSGGPSGASLTLDDARRVAGTTIPEASVMEGTLDAMLSVSAIRRANASAASARRQGGLRRAGFRGSGQRGLVDSDSGMGGAQDDASCGENWAHRQSSGTVSLNLWGNNNSLQNSLMHDDCSPQGQVLAGAGDASFNTEGSYPLQSIMDSMRHMQSMVGNSSFMPRTGTEQGVSGGGLERVPSNAATMHAQPPTPPPDPQGAHPGTSTHADGAVGNAAAGGSRSAPSVSTQECTTHSSGPLESTQLPGASSIADAAGGARPAADGERQAGDDSRRGEQVCLSPQQAVQPAQHAPKPRLGALGLAAGAPMAEKSTASTAAAGQSAEANNGQSWSSISCGPVHAADRGLGMSSTSRPPSPLAGTHTLPHTSRTGSLSQTLSHNSLSSPPSIQPARQKSRSVLNKPARAAGQTVGKLRQEYGMTSLAAAPANPGESLSGAWLSLDTLSPVSGPSPKPLSAGMLQTSAGVSSAGLLTAVSPTPHGAVRMDESIQGVQAWLQGVPDPADALAAPPSPSGSPRRHARARDKHAVKRQRS